ncbi:tonB-dependent receptor yncD [Escherichia coli]|nr:tonB-dependent receptor yncD [Escherichia coli]
MGMVIIIFSNVEHFLPLRLQFSQLLNVSCYLPFPPLFLPLMNKP